MKNLMLFFALLVFASCGQRKYDIIISLDLPDSTLQAIQVAIVDFDLLISFLQNTKPAISRESLPENAMTEEKKIKQDAFLAESWDKLLKEVKSDELWLLGNEKMIHPEVVEDISPFRKKNKWLVSKAFIFNGQLCGFAFRLEPENGSTLKCRLDTGSVVRLRGESEE